MGFSEINSQLILENHTDLMDVFTKKDSNFAIFLENDDWLTYAIRTPQKHQLLISVAFVKPVILQENLSKSFGLS